jgi:hypothetical protein
MPAAIAIVPDLLDTGVGKRAGSLRDWRAGHRGGNRSTGDCRSQSQCNDQREYKDFHSHSPNEFVSSRNEPVGRSRFDVTYAASTTHVRYSAEYGVLMAHPFMRYSSIAGNSEGTCRRRAPHHRQKAPPIELFKPFTACIEATWVSK